MTTVTPELLSKTKTAYYTRCRPEKTVLSGRWQEQAADRRSSRYCHDLLLPAPAACFLPLATGVMVLDFGDRRKWYLDDLAIGAFYLDAWSGEGLSGFHAANNAPDALAVNRYDLNIVFAVQRLKCCKCFGDFHVYLFSEIQTPGT